MKRTILLVVFMILCVGCRNPGEPVPDPVFGTPTAIAAMEDGYPNRFERAVAVYLNAARMAPLEYKSVYMTRYTLTGILERYPAVPPVTFRHALNRAARFHSEDMLRHGFFLHSSSDGADWTTRVRSFDTAATLVGEIQAQCGSPQEAVNLLLYDNGTADHPDSFDAYADGHRWIIMRANARQVGVGQAGEYYTADFVANSPRTTPPLIAVCHDFMDSVTITFLANYYDVDGNGPKRIACFVDGVEYPLTLSMGVAAMGTYSVALHRSAVTRSYYFMALDNEGVTWRYPYPGAFMSVGEGSGAAEYAP